MAQDTWRRVLGEVKIAPPDPEWSALFAAERAVLEGMRPRPFAAIEHFGSTAVAGLAAKPVIDIMAAVETLESMDGVEPALADKGYQRLDVGFRRRRFYHKPDLGTGAAVNLHVVTSDRWDHKGERLFRDWLAEHPAAARTYAALKTDLARRFPDDPNAYTGAKTEFIRKVVNAARHRIGLPDETDWDE